MKTNTMIFVTGGADPFKDLGDRRFWPIPHNFSEHALDAGVAAWFGVTKVEAEKNFIRSRMGAAVEAVLESAALVAVSESTGQNGLLDASATAAPTAQPVETLDGDRLKWLIDALSCEALIEVGIFPFVMSSDSDWRVLVDDAMQARAKRSQEGTCGTATSKALQAVIAERRRQQSDEGWTPEHDDGHVNDEIAAMAAYYAMPVGARDWPASETGYGATFGEAIRPEGWQAKESDRWDELVKAGALVLAELERLERADAVSTGGGA